MGLEIGFFSLRVEAGTRVDRATVHRLVLMLRSGGHFGPALVAILPVAFAIWSSWRSALSECRRRSVRDGSDRLSGNRSQRSSASRQSQGVRVARPVAPRIDRKALL